MKTKIKFLLVALVAFTAFSITSCSKDDPAPTPTPQTIVEIAQGKANLSLLVQALTKAGLVNTLNSPGTYTVFAPDNAAFTAAGLTSDAINALTTPEEITGLKNVLLNHVIGSKIMSSDIPPSIYVSTLSPINVTPGAHTSSRSSRCYVYWRQS
jgi:uncharacterized surface protein with fasciclin (FAS1) repeats